VLFVDEISSLYLSAGDAQAWRPARRAVVWW